MTPRNLAREHQLTSLKDAIDRVVSELEARYERERIRPLVDLLERVKSGHYDESALDRNK